jgi:hypothetical protein
MEQDPIKANPPKGGDAKPKGLKIGEKLIQCQPLLPKIVRYNSVQASRAFGSKIQESSVFHFKKEGNRDERLEERVDKNSDHHGTVKQPAVLHSRQ